MCTSSHQYQSKSFYIVKSMTQTVAVVQPDHLVPKVRTINVTSGALYAIFSANRTEAYLLLSVC
jgi:hypothetical protein